MLEEFNRHRPAYLVLLGGLILLTLAFVGAWPSRVWQRVVVLMLMFFYFSWGVITHVKAKHVTRKVLLEYLGMSVLVGTCLFLITL